MTILLLLLTLCVVLWLTPNPPFKQQDELLPEADSSSLSVSTSAVPAEFELPEIAAWGGSLPVLSGNTNSSETLRDRFVRKKLPGLLAEKEGSYANLSELIQRDEAFGVDLHSDWATRYFFPNTNLPNLKVRIMKNQETGEYEPAGGALTLPGGSVEAGYEIDPGTGESKATLQWKKSF